jgi:hypothetical protein
MSSFGIDKAVTFRQPATANLMIDSKDRDENRYASPWDFQITRPQNVQNGFMTRIGTTEVVLEWYHPNITTENNYLSVDISGASSRTTHTITLEVGFYTVAEAFDEIVQQLNDLSGTTGVSFDILAQRAYNSEFALVATGGEYFFDENTPLANALQIYLQGLVPEQPLFYGADLRRYRYIDFTSSQLTYNQDLKDNTTGEINRDVLCRWYMAYDDAKDTQDQYGYPILMGYFPFVLRRLFNPPKQIKWDPIQPVGNLAFQVFGSDNNLISVTDDGYSQWLMTLQLSEN